MNAARVGAWLLVVRPLYILSEVVVAAAVVGDYSFVDDTVSALGVVGCPVDASVAPGCSPRHALMNGSFIGYGVLLAVGVLLLAPRLLGDRRGRWALAMLLVTAVSSVATGLAPLDRDDVVHLAVALPIFVAQPLGLALLGWQRWHVHRPVALVLLVGALVTALGAIGFGLLLDADRGGGLSERLALWPAFVALAAYGVSELRGDRTATPRSG